MYRQTITRFIASNPQRLKQDHEASDIDRRLMVEDIEYNGPAQKREKMESMREHLKLVDAKALGQEATGIPAKRLRTEY